MAYEVPGLGVQSELQLQPTPHHDNGILNPLSEARDGLCILTDTMLGT